MAEESLKAKVTGLIDQVKYNWKKPPKGRYMSFKEIASYSFGGIGAYLIVSMSYICMLATTNTFITGTLGITPTDMYILYVLAVVSSIPLTGLRASIVDNTRNKAGKYRPYILMMGVPSALLFIGMVWFPYDKLKLLVGNSVVIGDKTADYIAKCAVLLLFNVVLQFVYMFFYDAYENLIHVLSPNSQERADVASVKSIVYSLGPSIVNLIMPIVAQNVFKTNSTDVRVYRLVFPILGIIGSALLVLVYANTQEKIIQAKTHTIQIKFTDALRAVAKNKYFWIISLASWIGFLEMAYTNILFWIYNYGGSISGDVYSIVVTLNGNASLWGMLLAPFCIRKWGKKKVQIVTNLFNIMFILLMLPFVINSSGADGNMYSYVIWAVLACLYANGIVSAFAHILNPSIQADIRDYQQYRTGERIDGMFAAVATIGSVITLITSSVIPALQEKLGMTVANAKRVVSDPILMSRVLPGAKQTIGQMLQEQAANGQDLYNASNALYDVNGVLIPLLRVLIIVSAIGATLNVIPFLLYDLTEKKQKCYVRVLKVRAVFEDYGNKALKDKDIVEMIDLVNNAKEMAVATPKVIDKASYRNVSDEAERKAAKKQYRADIEYNEEIEISKFVVDELNKFDSDLGRHQVAVYSEIAAAGLDGIKNTTLSEAKADLKKAKALPKNTNDEKEFRKFDIELAKNRISAVKSYNKYFGSVNDFVELTFDTIEKYYDREDEIDDLVNTLTKELHIAKKDKDSQEVSRIKAEIKKLTSERKELNKLTKEEMDKHAKFNRAAKPYVDAKKLLTQQENFSHFDEIAAQYDVAKANVEESDRLEAEAEAKRIAEEKEELERRKAEKAAKKAAKKNK